MAQFGCILHPAMCGVEGLQLKPNLEMILRTYPIQTPAKQLP